MAINNNENSQYVCPDFRQNVRIRTLVSIFQALLAPLPNGVGSGTLNSFFVLVNWANNNKQRLSLCMPSLAHDLSGGWGVLLCCLVNALFRLVKQGMHSSNSAAKCIQATLLPNALIL